MHYLLAMQTALPLDAAQSEWLTQRNGLWGLIVFLLLKEIFRLVQERSGPAWSRNGKMDDWIDQLADAIDSAPNTSSLRKETRQLGRRMDRLEESARDSSRVLIAMAKEVNSSRFCVHRPTDAAGIAAELERKQQNLIDLGNVP